MTKEGFLGIPISFFFSEEKHIKQVYFPKLFASQSVYSLLMLQTILPWSNVVFNIFIIKVKSWENLTFL